MKKLIYILVFLSFSSISSYAQSITGKWSIPMQSKDLPGSLVLDFNQSGIVTMSILGIIESEICQCNINVSITGRYENAGKALCIIYNNDAKASYNFAFQDIVSQAKRNEIANAFRSVWPQMEKEMIKRIAAYASAGLYVQILQLNDSLLIIKYPDDDPMAFTRIK